MFIVTNSDTYIEKWSLFKVNPNTTNALIRYFSYNFLSKSVEWCLHNGNISRKDVGSITLQIFIANSEQVPQVTAAGIQNLFTFKGNSYCVLNIKWVILSKLFCKPIACFLYPWNIHPNLFLPNVPFYSPWKHQTTKWTQI